MILHRNLVWLERNHDTVVTLDRQFLSKHNRQLHIIKDKYVYYQKEKYQYNFLPREHIKRKAYFFLIFQVWYLISMRYCWGLCN